MLRIEGPPVIRAGQPEISKACAKRQNDNLNERNRLVEVLMTEAGRRKIITNLKY
jgi:hypothetical protein